jgi:hypothetical protein
MKSSLRSQVIFPLVEKVSCTLMATEVHYRTYKSLALVPALKHMSYTQGKAIPVKGRGGP